MEESNKLFILWTNADFLTSDKMVMMYATNSMLNHWWDEVTVIIWGATAKMAAENEMIREKIKLAQQAGVKFSACRSCADQLGTTERLIKLGVEVIYWGKNLTDILKTNGKLITI
ncbi:MAG: DsrE family protein [Oscillospiraceae bacterium]